jgi:Tfp pilus assembly protein PilN
MIRINLLPPEYRKVDGTPIARFVSTTAGVLVVACAAGAWGYVHMALLDKARDERAQKEEELTALKAQAERSQALVREFKEYERRRKTIEQIGASRILWSKKLDELADIIHNKGDVKRHLVWLNSVRTQGGRFPTSPASLVIHGWCGGDYDRLSQFNADIKKNEEYFSDFLGIDPPAGTAVWFDDEMTPDSAFDFTFAMDLKQTNWRDKQ